MINEVQGFLIIFDTLSYIFRQYQHYLHSWNSEENKIEQKLLNNQYEV